MATRAGAYWSTSGRFFQALDVGRIAAPVWLVAFREVATPDRRGETREILLLGEAGLERLLGFATPTGLRVIEHEALPLPRPRNDSPPVDLAVAEEAWMVVYPDALAVGEPGRGAPAWRRRRPTV